MPKLTHRGKVLSKTIEAKPLPAFLTGSRVYGTPKEDSDIDLVVFMDKNTYWKLIEFAVIQATIQVLVKKSVTLAFTSLMVLLVNTVW